MNYEKKLIVKQNFLNNMQNGFFIKCYARQIIAIIKIFVIGYNYYFFIKIFFRDIKPENFVFSGELGSTLKLIDFGFSKMFITDDIEL